MGDVKNAEVGETEGGRKRGREDEEKARGEKERRK